MACRLVRIVEHHGLLLLLLLLPHHLLLLLLLLLVMLLLLLLLHLVTSLRLRHTRLPLHHLPLLLHVHLLLRSLGLSQVSKRTEGRSLSLFICEAAEVDIGLVGVPSVSRVSSSDLLVSSGCASCSVWVLDSLTLILRHSTLASLGVGVIYLFV